jgi:hypothetical protein
MANAFQIDATSGSLQTNFAPKDFMKGYFSFKVQAKDTGKFFFFSGVHSKNIFVDQKIIESPTFNF